MTIEAQRRVEAALARGDAAERYARRQRMVRRGRSPGADRPRPLEFDANGFPIPQPVPAFVRRVARLLRED